MINSDNVKALMRAVKLAAEEQPLAVLARD
jgi:hypothetical protein